MKLSALRFLVCPGCRSDLEAQVRSQEGDEVLEGGLRCRACGRGYPVVRGVPRFAEDDAYAASFGYQWNRFRAVQLDSCSHTRESERALEAATGWTARDYADRLVLDAGVGAGRFAEVAADKGAEVVGVDLSCAVDAAYTNVGQRPRVHIIQADIFALPFRDRTFDLAYSMGVLHHTPDTRAAFERVAATVRPGGGLAVYLYARYGPLGLSDAIRTVTTRLPAPVMVGLSTLAVPLYYPYRLPVIGKLLRMLSPISMHVDWRRRWLDTFDWYTPRYQWKLLYPEVFRWFRENGFDDVRIFDEPIRMRGLKAGVAAHERSAGSSAREGAA